MNRHKTVIFFLLFLSFLSAKAQEIDLYVVTIKGVIVGADDGEPIPYVHVINPREHSATTTNADGYFSISMLTDDTLIIKSIGYEEYHFKLKEFPPKELYKIILNPVRYKLNEITVKGDAGLKKKLGLPDAGTLDIPIELRGSDYNKKPPLIAAFFNPVSYLNYHLNGEEKEKRATLKAIKNNEEWIQFSAYFNLENIKRITGLKDEEADRFMIYCNLNNRLPYFASQMEVEFEIMDLYFKYKKEKEARDSIQ
ncbi:MAG TPA: carboxypeptidase-like regulatory domain-containing protein [Prolixibacteraceae bacterium]|nr:carboxypeptidase-like regulatory domain-containing protein [Prolixibacteraceae bacterium]HPS12091.1 carboxypeptidase-like regulatory domain-containing protein [Prolixibacteraceae bacterium]